MILPGSYAATLAILVVGLLCGGFWANTFKAAGPKWRYELFYVDFALGALIAAILAGLTLGSLGWDGFSLIDDLRLAGKRQELFAFIAGAIFNLGNMLMMAAVSIAGLSIAFPITMGVGLALAGIAAAAGHHTSNMLLMMAGSVVAMVSVAFCVVAWKSLSSGQARSSGWPKPVVLALAGGVLLGAFPRLIDMARIPEVGLGPYGLGAVFAAAVFFSTLVYNLFLMNLPVQGQPVEFSRYLRGTFGRHLLGISGGVLWFGSLLAALIAVRAEGPARVSSHVLFAMSEAAGLITALCGLVGWGEFRDGSGEGKTYLGLGLFLFALALAILAASTASAAP